MENVHSLEAIYKNGDIQSFLLSTITISIQDIAENAEEQQAAAVKKHVKKIGSCPDETHLRLYFDNITHLAIPFTCESSCSENELHALDKTQKLHYVIRKER